MITTEITIPLLSLTTPRVLRTCKSYPLAKEDELSTLFIASYPKSGTTWMQWIIFTLLSLDNPELSDKFTHISHFTPFYEIEKTWVFPLDESEESVGSLNSTISDNHHKLGYHVFNTHLPYNWLPKDEKTGSMKYIYLVRNSKDVAVSFYHHLTNQIDDNQYSGEGGFSQFLQDFLDGKIVYGKWLYHLSYWLPFYEENELHEESSGDKNPILLVQYEKLLSHPFEEVRKIINFLELKNIPDERLQEEVLPRLSFDYMKQNLSHFSPISVPWKAGFEFIRKGKVNDHTGCFTKEDYNLHEQSMIRDLVALSNRDISEISDIRVNDLVNDMIWLNQFKTCIGLSDLE